jgi:hypothetical protein
VAARPAAKRCDRGDDRGRAGRAGGPARMRRPRPRGRSKWSHEGLAAERGLEVHAGENDNDNEILQVFESIAILRKEAPPGSSRESRDREALFKFLRRSTC